MLTRVRSNLAYSALKAQEGKSEALIEHVIAMKNRERLAFRKKISL